ncbi:hypothetical protein CC86DRAFT_320848 [Ophiobolus disseminans]|uniref:Zn(2)-C6 fungal-type domain-containing protein n=1 Tax=Ophiobolus disseminans TaxID=1469910 RepID=A0A6A7A4I0_9PLEO|nr:hypothetical protein CC86DRAFT_320848 [Ophiobolus disseminans]
MRDLAPRPPGAPGPISEPPTPTRHGKVAVACGTCRVRRTKCDGVKPTCRACITRTSKCEWPASMGQQLAQEQKQMIHDLKNDKSALYEVLWYLQTTNPESAGELLDQLRSKPLNDVGAIVQHFAQYRHKPPDNAITSSDMSVVSRDPTPVTPNTPEFKPLSRVLNVRGGVIQPDDMATHTARHEGATAFSLDGPLEWFFNCVGALFYIMNPDEVRQKVQLLQASSDARTPLGDLVTPRKDPRTATLAAELAGMASIGIVHANLHDSTASPPIELADYFYAVAKMGLDAAIQHNPVRAVKICALVAMYNIVVHATISLAYLDLGLSLARRCGMDARECSPHLSSAAFGDMSRTYRTLVHLQCWLSASLDYVPDALGSATLAAVEHEEAPPNDMIMRECVKVSIIKALMLHQIPNTSPVPEAKVADFRIQLSTFHSQLADWMSLGQLLSNDPDSLHYQFQPIIFYIHMFYLSAMMLLSRRLVIAYVSQNATGKVMLPPEARLAIQEGFAAAQTNARVMDLMLSEGKVVQVCWLCIFTSYTAGVMVAYGAVQKANHGLSFDSDMELLDKCIRVLSYCALKDAMAGRFRDLLNCQLNALQEAHSAERNAHKNSASKEAAPVDILFTFDSEPSTLHTAARGLLNLIQRPFSGMANIPTQTTLSNRAETTAGAHLEWEYELRGSECADTTREPAETYGVNVEAGVPMDHSMSQPHEGAWTTWTPLIGI